MVRPGGGMFGVALLAFLLLACAAPRNGKLQGTVTIPGGEPIGGVVVVAKRSEPEESHSTVTNRAGVFRLYVPGGTYTLLLHYGKAQEIIRGVTVLNGKTTMFEINGERLWSTR